MTPFGSGKEIGIFYVRGYFRYLGIIQELLAIKIICFTNRSQLSELETIRNPRLSLCTCI